MTFRKFSLTALLLASVLSAPSTAHAADDDIQFYPIESFTLVSTMTGMNAGTKTMHVKDYGRTYVEIEQSTMSMMGFTQTTNKRTIVQGANITTIDEAARTITTSVNPMYENIANQVRNAGSGTELGRTYMQALGHTPTGQTAIYAGETCEIWSSSQFAQNLCVTEEGIVLYIASNMMGMSMATTATELLRGDPGPDAAYGVPDYPVTQAPNLQNLLNRGGQ